MNDLINTPLNHYIATNILIVLPNDIKDNSKGDTIGIPLSNVEYFELHHSKTILTIYLKSARPHFSHIMLEGSNMNYLAGLLHENKGFIIGDKTEIHKKNIKPEYLVTLEKVSF